MLRLGGDGVGSRRTMGRKLAAMIFEACRADMCVRVPVGAVTCFVTVVVTEVRSMIGFPTMAEDCKVEIGT